MVLLICDFAVGPVRPLTYLVGRLTPVLEGLLVVILVAGIEMGSLLKPSTAIAGRVSPASLGVVVVWFVGLYVINKASKGPRWSVDMPGSRPGRDGSSGSIPSSPIPSRVRRPRGLRSSSGSPAPSRSVPGSHSREAATSSRPGSTSTA
jgi:hypothetical protein